MLKIEIVCIRRTSISALNKKNAKQYTVLNFSCPKKYKKWFELFQSASNFQNSWFVRNFQPAAKRPQNQHFTRTIPIFGIIKGLKTALNENLRLTQNETFSVWSFMIALEWRKELLLSQKKRWRLHPRYLDVNKINQKPTFRQSKSYYQHCWNTEDAVMDEVCMQINFFWLEIFSFEIFKFQLFLHFSVKLFRNKYHI